MWHGDDNLQPIITQNLFRLKAGRFEHIGQAWAKWGFASSNDDFCGTCQYPPGGWDELGVNCSDAYGSMTNGNQSSLGPKSSVNPFTGDHPFPHATPGSGTLPGRLQVSNSKVDPAQNSGATYFIESLYVAQDDAAAGNAHNNSSYRQVWISGSAFNLTFNNPGGGSSTTVVGEPAINAWQAADASVRIRVVDVPDDGRIHVAWKATGGPSSWDYELAIQNVTSDRAIGAVDLPLPPSVVASNLGFNDVAYHSGEPYDGTDWPGSANAGLVGWATDTYAQDSDANALRWGTIYNFRFTADAAPGYVRAAVLELFKPGSPDSITVPLAVAGDLDGDDQVDEADFAGLPPCFEGPDVGITPGCAAADFDMDGDIDLGDVADFQDAFGS